MAKLDRPLYGVEATGTFARALAFRKTTFYPTVARLPLSKTSPSPGQSAQRILYRAACSAWSALTPAEQQVYIDTRPLNLSGFNLFIRLYLSDTFAYFYYCVFGQAVFMLVKAPDQPAQVDYETDPIYADGTSFANGTTYANGYSPSFPYLLDEFPVLREGADSCQAWFLNHIYASIISIENFLIDNKPHIEG